MLTHCSSPLPLVLSHSHSRLLLCHVLGFALDAQTTVMLIHRWYDGSRCSPSTLDILDVKCMSVCPVLGNVAVAQGRNIHLFSVRSFDSGIVPYLVAVVSTPLVVGKVALCQNYLAYASPSQVRSSITMGGGRRERSRERSREWSREVEREREESLNPLLGLLFLFSIWTG